MPKFYCNNTNCNSFEKLVDIDSSFVAYFRNLDHKDFKLVNGKLCCIDCQSELELVRPEESKSPLIGKYGTSSYEEKMNMLKKRSKDLSINENKIIKERKEYMDRNGITKYVN